MKTKMVIAVIIMSSMILLIFILAGCISAEKQSIYTDSSEVPKESSVLYEEILSNNSHNTKTSSDASSYKSLQSSKDSKVDIEPPVQSSHSSKLTKESSSTKLNSSRTFDVTDIPSHQNSSQKHQISSEQSFDNNTSSKKTESIGSSSSNKEPVTTSNVSSKPSGYLNAWDTIKNMELELAEYARSIGMIYDHNATLDDGSWITPTKSDGWGSANKLKQRIRDDLLYEKERGNTHCRVIFFTRSTALSEDAGIYGNYVLDEFVGCKENELVIYIVIY